MENPRYQRAAWGLRVLDFKTGEVLIDENPDKKFYIASMRKVFSMGLLLNQVGPNYTYDTPVYRKGSFNGGVLNGNLVLVASGDLTMGGRANFDGSILLSQYDHNEANSLGNAVLTKSDVLAGYRSLARQVAASGVKTVQGDVVIDDRLFPPYHFRDEFYATPIFVNDDAIDLTIRPSRAGQAASVAVRPVTAAMPVRSTLMTGAAGSALTLAIKGTDITGSIPLGMKPPLTNEFPLVQTVRITDPSGTARTVFIECLKEAGVVVKAGATGPNPASKLPPKDSYKFDERVALLRGSRLVDNARFVLKVSYNLGADISLILFGLTQKRAGMAEALKAEKMKLETTYGIPPAQIAFVDGSGGGETTATTFAVTHMLEGMGKSPVGKIFADCLPGLGVDGSLGFVDNYKKDPTLKGATAKVKAKTGTYATSDEKGIHLKGQAMCGYIDARSGRRLVYEVVVNGVEIKELLDVIGVFQDEGTISALLWRDF